MASNRAAEFNGGDDEEEALRQAIAMSLGDEVTVPAKDTKHIQPSSGGNSLPATSLSALGIDRRKMEEERLARLKKRKAEANFDTRGREEELPPAQRPKMTNVKSDDQPRLSQSALPTPPSGQNPKPSSNKVVSQMPGGSATIHLPYPKGTVLRTWARGNPRQDDISIEEVLQKDHLELAVLSSFQWDEEWLMAKLNMKKTKVLLIAYAPDEAAVRLCLCLFLQLPRKEESASSANSTVEFAFRSGPHPDFINLYSRPSMADGVNRKTLCRAMCLKDRSGSVSHRWSMVLAVCTRSYSFSNSRSISV